MNYLAHVFLARDTPESKLGQLLGDFSRGLDVGLLPPSIREGVLAHRAIDAFTDAHPLVRKSRQRLDPRFRHLRSVLVDVFHDHFLVRHWERFAERGLAEVTGQLYGALETYRHLLPERLRSVARSMARDDWLGSYGEVGAVERALRGMERRLRRRRELASGVEELRSRYGALEEDFLAFFPDLLASRDLLGSTGSARQAPPPVA